jgi:hypothetical protein
VTSTCDLTHPGWAAGIDYRHLSGDEPRLWRVSVVTPARLIDHERQECTDDVALVAGTTAWWVGSSYELDHTGGASGKHVFAVLDGPLRGECVELSGRNEAAEDEPPASLEHVRIAVAPSALTNGGAKGT